MIDHAILIYFVLVLSKPHDEAPYMQRQPMDSIAECLEAVESALKVLGGTRLYASVQASCVTVSPPPREARL